MGEEIIGSGDRMPLAAGRGRRPASDRGKTTGAGAELMAVKREENPAGSSNNPRGDVQRVLGVLKVATVEQIRQISAPHLSYRHTDKPTPSKRKQARTASHTGALSGASTAWRGTAGRSRVKTRCATSPRRD
ncbi:hypothetical protein [Streptomyces albogriseolus]|uniref:hypothetical protein n=1 Tax=Streptomyces albogriseolus TaxID=1887 RepID=UPI0033A001C3